MRLSYRGELAAVVASLACLLQFADADNTPTYDYVIVGGGTSGLVLANRLSENPNITVAVIEPGTDQRNNVNVTNADYFGRSLKSSIDWDYQSVPQAQMNNRILKYSAGKGIGGSSLINGMAFLRGDKAQFDSWAQLGNPGWNWNLISSRSIQLENFISPTPSQVEDGASYNPAYHGIGGAVHTGFRDSMVVEPFFDVVKASWNSIGIPHITDPNGGSTRGFAARPETQDPTTNYRWDSATAFWWPIIQSRPNLHLINGQVSRVLFKSGTGTLTASGIWYHYYNGTTAEVGGIRAAKEVILCAGALRSPGILEQSGVGNSTFLKKLGIATIIDLPGVGRNLNDQPSATLHYQSNFTQPNATTLVTFVNAKDIFGSEFNAVNASSYQSIGRWATQLSGGDSEVATALDSIFRVQHGLIFKSLVSIGEILTTNGNKATSAIYWNLMPFSRGSVHLKAKSNWQDAAIDPAWFQIDFDVAVQAALGRFAARLWTTAPANHYIVQRTSPSTTILPDNASDSQWESFHRATASTADHALGTLAMRSRNLMGVVDSNLIMYGTHNVRIADASVIPGQFSGHPSSIVYAIAQRASELILGQ